MKIKANSNLLASRGDEKQKQIRPQLTSLFKSIKKTLILITAQLQVGKLCRSKMQVPTKLLTTNQLSVATIRSTIATTARNVSSCFQARRLLRRKTHWIKKKKNKQTNSQRLVNICRKRQLLMKGAAINIAFRTCAQMPGSNAIRRPFHQPQILISNQTLMKRKFLKNFKRTKANIDVGS